MKFIQGFEGLYSINEYGNVWSHNKEIFLKNVNKGRRYYHVNIYKNGKIFTYDIHRLVALTYIDNPENKSTVNHIDSNKLNNHITNLEWLTPKENIAHSVINGTRKNVRGKDHYLYGKVGHMKGRKGKNHPAHGRLGNGRKKVIHVNTNTVYESMLAAAKATGCIFSLVSKVANGDHKQTNGNVFKFL